ncbi:hypothetical protein GCM10010266_45400 [Streptomyces griseomycini]|nr:hypothetical protein GCM10010266_45400 [Streptomyces griseomycini]GGR40850.1 hypothetical protein GCM10015536_53210 [Streptomyces griseomycini]
MRNDSGATRTGARGVRGGAGENGAGPAPCHPVPVAAVPGVDARHRTRRIVSIRLIYPDYMPGGGRVPHMTTDPRARHGRGLHERHVPFGALPLGISARPL